MASVEEVKAGYAMSSTPVYSDGTDRQMLGKFKAGTPPRVGVDRTNRYRE